METVIAIAVIAVLVTGFIAVFAPAIDGIRRSISIEEANRLTSTLERELVTVRDGQQPANPPTGFDKAFEWIRESNTAENALLIYQYRGTIGSNRADDNTPTPFTATDGVSGRDFVTVPMLRRRGDTKLAEDFQALEGRVYVVRCTQLLHRNDGNLVRGTLGQIVNSGADGSPVTSANNFNEAVLPFAAEFFMLPSRDPQYLNGPGLTTFFNERMRRPMFTRNLAVRR